MRGIHSFGVLALALVLAVGVSACATTPSTDIGLRQSARVSSAHADAIRVALAVDDSAGRARNHRCESAPLHVAVSEYVGAIDAIDLDETTPRFAAALRAHRDAWQALVGPLGQRSGLRGEMHDLFDRLTDEADPLHETFVALIEDVWATWGEVEGAAESAGVSLD